MGGSLGVQAWRSPNSGAVVKIALRVLEILLAILNSDDRLAPAGEAFQATRLRPKSMASSPVSGS